MVDLLKEGTELGQRLAVGLSDAPLMPGFLYTLPKALIDVGGALTGHPDPLGGTWYGRSSDFIRDKMGAYNEINRDAIGLPKEEPGVKGQIEELLGSIMFPARTGLSLLEKVTGAAVPKIVKHGTEFIIPGGAKAKVGITAVGAGVAEGSQLVQDAANRHLDAAAKAIADSNAQLAPQPGTQPTQPTSNDPGALSLEEIQATNAAVQQQLSAGALSPQEIMDTDKLVRNEHQSLIDDVLDWAGENKAAITAGLALVGAAVFHGKAKSMASLAREMSPYTGLNEAADVTPTIAKVVGGVADDLAPVTSVIKKLNKGKVPDDTASLITLSGAPASIAERISTALSTGTIAGSTARLGTDEIPSLYHAAQILAKVDEPTRQLAYEVLPARNAVSNIEQRNIPARPGDPPIADLKQIIAQGEAHPIVSKLIKFNDAFTQGMADYLHENKIISKDKLDNFKSAAYMPEVTADRKTFQTRLQDILSTNGKDDPVTDLSSLFKRDGTQGKLLPPIEALEQYAQATMRFVEQNTVRRKVIYRVTGAAKNGVRDYQGVITRVDGPSRRDGITIRNDGATEHYRVHDPALLTALRFNPARISPISNMLRRILQTFTTGRGAPWFSLTSLAYDAAAAAVLHPRGTKFGLFRGDIVGGTALSAGHALGAMGMKFAKAAEQALRVSLATDGTLVRIFGQDAVERLANGMGEAYARSTLGLFERYGAGGGSLTKIDDEIRNAYTQLHSMAPDFGSRAPLLRKIVNAYDGILESIQNGARLAYIARNVKEGMTKTEMFRLMAGTRQLTGDFSKSGSSQISKTMQSVFPYYNVTIQSQMQWARMFKAQPFHTMLGIVNGLALPAAALTYYASTMGPEYAEFYWKKLSSAQRDGYFYVPIPWLPPEKGIMIPMLPEFRPFAAMMRAGMDGLFGLSSGQINDEHHVGMRKHIDDFFGERDQRDIKAGVVSGLLPAGSIPPGPNALLAASGINVDLAEGSAWESGPLSSSPLDPVAGTIQNDVMSKSMANTIIALAGTMGQFMINSFRAGVLQYRHDGNFTHAIGAGAQQLGLDIGSRVPVVNTTLLGQQIKQSRNTVDSKVYFEKTKALGDIAKGYSNDVAHPGSIGASAPGAIVREGEYATGLQDPALSWAVAYISKAYPIVQKLDFQVTKLNSQIADVNADQRTSPKEKLAAINRLNKEMVAAQGAALDNIREHIEDPLRHHYHREIDITKLNRGAKLTDFAPIQ